MRKTLHLLFVTMLLALVGAGSMRAEETKNFSFVQTGATAGDLSADAPKGVTATFSTTYKNSFFQLTKGNSMTLTLKGFEKGTKIVGVTLEVKNNKSTGNGTATILLGENQLGTLSVTGLGSNYALKEISPFTAGTVSSPDEEMKIEISATVNSVYCQKFIVSYQEPVSGKTATTLSFPENADVTLDLNATAGLTFTKTATLTPAVEGASIKYASDNTAIATVEEATGAVTVTPAAEGTATITATYDGNDTFDGATASYTITVKDPNQPRWVKTDLPALTPADKFVIVELNNKVAMLNDGGDNTPKSLPVTLNDEQTELTGTVADNVIWNVASTADGYIFYPNGTTDTWLYTTDTSKGVRIGTGANKYFKEQKAGQYNGLLNTGSSRSLVAYGTTDWRCYANTSTATSIAYFKRYAAGEKIKTSTTVAFAAGNKVFYQGDTEGLTFTNAATLTPAVEGAAITYSSSNESVAKVDAGTGAVTVSTANAGSATITASYAGNDEYAPSSASYTVTVSQVYENIAALKAAYASANVEGALKLTNAKVTCVDGNNKYLEDASGAVCVYGQKVFTDYKAGSVLNGHAAVTYTLYNGLPEITAFAAAEDLAVTEGDVPAPVEMTITDAQKDENLCKYIVVKSVAVTAGEKAGNATARDAEGNDIELYKKGETFTDGHYDVVGIASVHTTKQISVIGYTPAFSLDENEEKNDITPGENGRVSLTRTFNAGAWNSLVLPFDMTAEQVAETFGPTARLASLTGVKANGDESYTLEFESATAIAANTPVFIYGAGDVTNKSIEKVNVVAGTPTVALNGNVSFVGTYVQTLATAGDWFVSADNKFYKAAGTEAVKATRAVFRLPASAGAKSLSFTVDGGVVTAISGLSTEPDAAPASAASLYNLAGQRVTTAYKGVVVQNGRKFINK